MERPQALTFDTGARTVVESSSAMNKSVKAFSVEPPYAIPGGEVAISCDGFHIESSALDGCYVDGIQCRIVAASSTRIIANVPDQIGSTQASLQLICGGAASNTVELTIAQEEADGMHMVANPAVDPSDDSVILTRSGTRGQHLPATLFRLEADGFLDELPEAILNPTGVAFDRDGQMFVTNRAQGEVYAVGRDGTSTVYATGLGIATGIAFDPDGVMYVGDRSGTIFRVKDDSEVETFSVLEASVAAFHMAFGPDGRLYVTSPGLASYDAVHAIDKDGSSERFFRGLGRPQGLAFDETGNLYVAACYKGRHGIVKISRDGTQAELFAAGGNIVGLCFDRKGNMLIATSDTVYSLPCGLKGTLLT